jgi:uncharacterized protein YbaP (TraB family)
MYSPRFPLLALWCTIFFCSAGCSEEDAVRGLAFRYDKDGQTGYLMGSVHFGDRSFYPLSASVMQAFAGSDVLVVEIDDANITLEMRQQMMDRYGLYPEGETLSDHLSQRTRGVVQALLDEFALPFEAVQHHKPGFLATVLMVLQAQKLGYQGEFGIDNFFLERARGHKTIREIEDFAFQMRLLGSIPDDDAILYQTFSNMHQYQTLWADMIAAWKEGDGASLYELTIGRELRAHPELAPYYRALFFDRHPRMQDHVQQCVTQRERCFVVVGAGHLVGEAGLVEGLKKQGYTVTQM